VGGGRRGGRCVGGRAWVGLPGPHGLVGLLLLLLLVLLLCRGGRGVGGWEWVRTGVSGSLCVSSW